MHYETFEVTVTSTARRLWAAALMLILLTSFATVPLHARTVVDIHDFNPSPLGAGPQARLLLANDGNYYGTTTAGGNVNAGTIYRRTPNGIYTVLYSFGGGSDGLFPAAGLTQGADGALYGVTQYGGDQESGNDNGDRRRLVEVRGADQHTIDSSARLMAAVSVEAGRPF